MLSRSLVMTLRFPGPTSSILLVSFPCPDYSPHLEIQGSGMLRGSHSIPNTVSDSSLLCYLHTLFSLRTLAWCLFLKFRLHWWSILFYCNGTRNSTRQWDSPRMQRYVLSVIRKQIKGQFHCFFSPSSGVRWEMGGQEQDTENDKIL